MEAKAIARFVRVSPQKARLVVDLIRGKRAAEALQILQFARKRIAADVAKLLRSAIANATERHDHLDVDQLWVLAAYVNDGPRAKRIRPAPMGRAYRYQRRSAHIGVLVGDRAGQSGSAAVAPVPAQPAKPAKSAAKPARRPPARRPGARPAAKASGRPAKTGRPAKAAKPAKSAAKPAAKPSGSKP